MAGRIARLFTALLVLASGAPLLSVEADAAGTEIAGAEDLLPASQYQYLTEWDLMNLGPPPYSPAWYRWLRLARNEIYARHGYIFQSRDLQSYFGQQSWYRPMTRRVAFSQVEQANIALIQSYER